MRQSPSAELAERFGAAGERGVRITLPITQDDLAAWIGASREAVVKALRSLRTRGWIETERRAVVIADVEALRRRAGLDWTFGGSAAQRDEAVCGDRRRLPLQAQLAHGHGHGRSAEQREGGAAAERTERRVARWIGSREEDGFGWAVVEAADTGEFLGLCGLLALPDEPGAVELATLLARAAWGRRLGSNVSAAMIDWLFAETDVARVVSFIHPDNVASRRAASGIGLVEGELTTYLDEEVLRYTRDAPRSGGESGPI